MNWFWSLVLAFGLLGQVTFADTEIRCLAKGNRAGGNGSGPFMVDADLLLALSWDKTAKGHVLNGAGLIKVASPYADLKSPEDLTEENSYIGAFHVVNSQENTNYRPRKYRGFIQFPSFDAVKTSGMEDGMWGVFLVQRIYKTAPQFQAKYIFQAGDHMGGTIHLTCTRH